MSSASSIPSPGLLAQHDSALAVDTQRLAHREIPPVEVPFGWIVGEFQEGCIRDPGRQMGIGQNPDAVGPGVGREDQVMVLRHGADPPQPRDAADQRGVRLQHVECPFDDEVAELVELARHLAPGDADVDLVAQAPHAFAIAAMQRLLHPVDPEGLEFARHLHGILERPGRIGVPGHAPALVAIDHQLELVAHARPHGFEGLDITPPVAAMEADLEGRKAFAEIALGRIGQFAGRAACLTTHRP